MNTRIFRVEGDAPTTYILTADKIVLVGDNASQPHTIEILDTADYDNWIETFDSCLALTTDRGWRELTATAHNAPEPDLFEQVADIARRNTALDRAQRHEAASLLVEKP